MKLIEKVMTGRILVAALLFTGAAITTLWAANYGAPVNEAYQKNIELKEILGAFGSGSVDVYLSGSTENGTSKVLRNVKIIRPKSAFGKKFFRARDAGGNIWLIAPDDISTIMVPQNNFSVMED